MQYGVKPERMSNAEWLIEAQCRHVARQMQQGRNSAERGAIFNKWQSLLPGVTKERVGQIWREGVPMPGSKGNTGNTEGNRETGAKCDT